MLLTIKYFGLIAEITNSTQENIEFSGATVSDLLDILYAKYDGLKTKDFQIAQNHELVSGETPIQSAEIALLPPFAGG